MIFTFLHSGGSINCGQSKSLLSKMWPISQIHPKSKQKINSKQTLSKQSNNKQNNNLVFIFSSIWKRIRSQNHVEICCAVSEMLKVYSKFNLKPHSGFAPR